MSIPQSSDIFVSALLTNIHNKLAKRCRVWFSCDLVKISQVLSDNQLRQDLISRGKRRAHDFSWQTMAEQTLDIYQQVIQK